jgi:signal transduction histidine kinase
MFYSYAKKNDQGALIKHATFDFFTIGWLIGILHLSMIPSTVYFIAILGNYIGMRGFHKFYRLLLVPVGVVMSFAIGDFQLYLESSTWIMILSIGYMSIHFVVLAGISYYFAKRSNDYNKLLISKNGVIEAQKEEILTQSQRMMELNSHLEELVQQRTHELEVKNKALGEYAFINAHQLRKPVANIMGLVNLFKNDQKIDNDFIEIIGHIKDSTKELDNTVRDIRDKLERENLIHKK